MKMNTKEKEKKNKLIIDFFSRPTIVFRPAKAHSGRWLPESGSNPAAATSLNLDIFNRSFSVK